MLSHAHDTISEKCKIGALTGPPDVSPFAELASTNGSKHCNHALGSGCRDVAIGIKKWAGHTYIDRVRSVDVDHGQYTLNHFVSRY